MRLNTFHSRFAVSLLYHFEQEKLSPGLNNQLKVYDPSVTTMTVYVFQRGYKTFFFLLSSSQSAAYDK